MRSKPIISTLVVSALGIVWRFLLFPSKIYSGRWGNTRLFGWSNYPNCIIRHHHRCLHSRLSHFRNDAVVLKVCSTGGNYFSQSNFPKTFGKTSMQPFRRTSWRATAMGRVGYGRAAFRKRSFQEREKGALAGQVYTYSGCNEPMTWPKGARLPEAPGFSRIPSTAETPGTHKASWGCLGKDWEHTGWHLYCWHSASSFVLQLGGWRNSLVSVHLL